jgi:hypothetical protein
MSSRHAGWPKTLWPASLRRLIRIFVHRTQIMFSVLEVIFCRDPVAARGFDAGQFQITLIISLGVLCVRATEPGRFSFPEPGVLWHCVGHILHLRARLCCRWLKFGSGFHKSPYVAAAKAVRRSLEELSMRQNRRAHARQQSKINGCAGTLNSRDKALSESGSTRHMWGAGSAISS